MTLIVRSIPDAIVPSTVDQPIEQTYLRFLLRKLSLRKGEAVVVIGCPERDAIQNLVDCVGESGRIDILLTQEQLRSDCPRVANLDNLIEQFPQLSVGQLGPSSEPQQASAVIIMPDRLMPPYEPLLQLAWRRLVSGGRLMLVLPNGDDETERLYQLIDLSRSMGFVSRYRRCCDKHTAWVGVKYAR